MIEIVFSDSACGSLKMAQGFGNGPYRSGCIGVLISHEDGSPATEEEIQAAQREAEEQARREWEQGVPMGGKASDVYGFHLVQSIGDISEEVPGPLREKALERIYHTVYPLENVVQALMQNPAAQLQEIGARAASGEDLRIWYSNNPDELCGLYWFMTQLPVQRGRVWLVKLPEWEVREDGTMTRLTGWGEVAPGEFARYLPLQKAAPEVFCRSCAVTWNALQIENAPLRAVVNGRLVGVPETFYDHLIRREIDTAPEVFQEARVVGNVLGKYQLGIGDCWVALRIEEMIRTGELQVETEPPADMPIYHRKLKK